MQQNHKEAAGKEGALPYDNMDMNAKKLLEEAAGYQSLGMIAEAEKTLQRVMCGGGAASHVAQSRLIYLLTGQRRFHEAAQLGQSLIDSEICIHSAIINTALAQSYLGHVQQARNTLQFVVDCGRPLEEEAYQMACFASKLGNFPEALRWLCFEFRRSAEHHACSFGDPDLFAFWSWLRFHSPTLEEAHLLIQAPWKDVCAAALDPNAPVELTADGYDNLVNGSQSLFKFDYAAGAFVLQPSAVANEPAKAAKLKRLRMQGLEMVRDIIVESHERAGDTVLDAQPRYAAAHAAWGNHLGARYHILWALSLRPALIVDFLTDPRLGMMKGFMTELLFANQVNPGFGRRMQEIAESVETDGDRAWQLLEETPQECRCTALFKAKLACFYNADKEYELALPVFEELRLLWPDDVLGFNGAINGLLKLERRDEARELLMAAPRCYRRFEEYWMQRAVLEGGEQRYRARGFPHFRGQPDLGARLIPEDEMKPEDRASTAGF